MLDYLQRKENILLSLQEGLLNKKYNKELNGLNARLDIIKDIKTKYSLNILNEITELTNYPIVENVLHGLDNVNYISKHKSNYYLYAINQKEISSDDAKILQECFLDNSNLIYISEKAIFGQFDKFVIIFTKRCYNNASEYINNKWQRR